MSAATTHGLSDPITVGVLAPADVQRANNSARQYVSRIGFSTQDTEEIALVVSELASNLIKHGGGGTIRLQSLQALERKGIQIESEDHGPGLGDPELALTDGYSTTSSLGNGLGTVNRLMDELEFHSRPQTGLRILCQRWIRPPRSALLNLSLEFGAATRACRLLPENGDALVIKAWESNALVGVIDGLGHGRFAQKASHAARHYVEQHFDQSLDNLFRGVGRACRATRGVVMALCRLDLVEQTLTGASVGNVEVRLLGGDRFHLIVRRGVLGLNAPEPVVTSHPWTPASILIVHSDGLRARWRWEDFGHLDQEPPATIARTLLRELAKPEDDATVVVVKNTTR